MRKTSGQPNESSGRVGQFEISRSNAATVGGRRWGLSVLSKPTARVRLSRISELAVGVTVDLGAQLWRVEWTEATTNGTDTMGHSHHTDGAARRHVQRLLSQVDPSLGNVYIEHLSVEL